MSLSKKNENIVIGVDPKHLVVNILANHGNDFKTVNIEQFACDKQLVENKKLFEVLSNVISAYLQDKTLQQPDVYIVLPNYFVSIDHTIVPNMQTAKMKDALKTELKRMYKEYFDLKEVKSSPIVKNKRQTLFSTTMINKEIIRDCLRVCKKFGLNLKNISYSANCLTNSFLALAEKSKHNNFVLVDVGESQTKLVFVNKDHTIAFEDIDYGLSFLNNSKTENLFDYQDNKILEFEIFTAKSSVKGKENFESFNEFYELVKKSSAEEKNYAYKDENLTPLQQNFATIVRFAEAFAESISNNYNFDLPEEIIVNLPESYESAIENQDSKIKLTILRNEFAEPCLLTDFLDLYGMIYAVSFNKEQNFVDKENLTMGVKFSAKISGKKNVFKKSNKGKE